MCQRILQAIAFMKIYYCQRLPLAIANKYRHHPIAIPASTIFARHWVLNIISDSANR
ncbi:hypothetical protein [Nostoc sp. WHI]|uniref:hypothetical protein n=1 Tax=Nostoc sp. WHI TaxID=2650611 RepID=UPI001E4DCCFD|nr:hypothetical protein [Nostoc sp. WHI]